MPAPTKLQIGFLVRCQNGPIPQAPKAEMEDGWACYKGGLVARIEDHKGRAFYEITEAGRTALAALPT